MSMEALIDPSALLEHLESKKEELPERLGKLVQDVSNIYKNAVVLEAPRITGNLKSSIRVEDIDDFTRRVYPDEHQAPYAEYVIRGVRGKAFVGENDFLGRGAEQGKAMSEGTINEFLGWLKS